MQVLDDSLSDDIEVIKSIIQFDHSGRLDLFNQPDEASIAYAYKGRLHYLIRDERRRPIRRSANMAFIELPMPQLIENKALRFCDISFANKSYRLHDYIYDTSQHAGNQDIIIQVIRPLANYENERESLIYAMLQLAPIPIILVGLGGWWISGRALRPLNGFITTVNNIGTDDLSTRILVAGNDEVGKLGTSFNTFLNRIESGFVSLRRFTADASHELRTPLTSMRTQAEVALVKIMIMGSMLEEIDRLEHLTNSLLQFARSDAGLLKIEPVNTNLATLILRWLEYLNPLAEEKMISIVTDTDNQIVLDIDEVIFERIIINIIENAIHFTPKSGWIKVKLMRKSDKIQLKVCDSGSGIPDEAKQIIFERFVRLDHSRRKNSWCRAGSGNYKMGG